MTAIFTEHRFEPPASKNAPGIKMTPGADGRISCGCGRAGNPGSVQP